MKHEESKPNSNEKNFSASSFVKGDIYSMNATKSAKQHFTQQDDHNAASGFGNIYFSSDDTEANNPMQKSRGDAKAGKNSSGSGDIYKVHRAAPTIVPTADAAVVSGGGAAAGPQKQNKQRVAESDYNDL